MPYTLQIPCIQIKRCRQLAVPEVMVASGSRANLCQVSKNGQFV
jgi:hypothetical protein